MAEPVRWEDDTGRVRWQPQLDDGSRAWYGVTGVVIFRSKEVQEYLPHILKYPCLRRSKRAANRSVKREVKRRAREKERLKYEFKPVGD